MVRNVRETHSEYLRDPEFAALYLSDALEEGNLVVIRMALKNIAEAQRGDWGGEDIRPEPKWGKLEDLLPKTGDFTVVDLSRAVQALGLKLRIETQGEQGACSEKSRQAQAV